jgi:hemerythrin-like domain-containing protein
VDSERPQLDAIDRLYDEHRHIVTALEALDVALGHVNDGEPDLGFFELAVDFFRVYADGSHYEKEEKGLFAALGEKGFPGQVGPVGCLTMEHDASRAEAEQLAMAVDGIKTGAARWSDVALASARYSAILRVHMPKENLCFFPMARHALSPAQIAELTERFSIMDAELPALMELAAQGLKDRVAQRKALPPADARPPKPLFEAMLEEVVESLSRPAGGAFAMPPRVRRR